MNGFWSVLALSQTASLYSRSGLIKKLYIFSRASLFVLNLSARNKLNFVQAVVVMLFIPTAIFLEKVRPRCLCDVFQKWPFRSYKEAVRYDPFQC